MDGREKPTPPGKIFANSSGSFFLAWPQTLTGPATLGKSFHDGESPRPHDGTKAPRERPSKDVVVLNWQTLRQYNVMPTGSGTYRRHVASAETCLDGVKGVRPSWCADVERLHSGIS